MSDTQERLAAKERQLMNERGLREHLFAFINTEDPTEEHISGVQQNVLPQIHDILLHHEQDLEAVLRELPSRPIVHSCELGCGCNFNRERDVMIERCQRHSENHVAELEAENAALREQLAASQKNHQDALTYCEERHINRTGVQDEIDEAVNAAKRENERLELIVNDPKLCDLEKEQARAEERERCAKIADLYPEPSAGLIAAAIRAEGEK